MHGIPGWFGKLPTLSDFASRRLPPAFIEPWDDWLSAGLAAWRAADPQWLDAYLAAPTWCFVLGPEALAGGPSPTAGSAWAGVLMPSVDGVGRYFPLTVASAVSALSEADAPRLAHWLRHTADRASDAMHQDWTPAQLDDALIDLNELTWPHIGRDDEATDFALALRRITAGGARTLWWPSTADGHGQFQALDGLPTGPGLARLLGASAGRAP